MSIVAEGELTPGAERVIRLLETGDYEAVDLSPDEAHQALAALESLKMPYLVSELIEGAEGLAEQIHSRAARGLQEVVQNADDQGASWVRFGYRRRGSSSELLVAHNGKPVDVPDVLRIATPLVSGSRDDPEKIGRFGVGLKTLNQLGDALSVHCDPLPGFEVIGGRIKLIDSPRTMPSFWDRKSRDTLFVLRLRGDDFDLGFFREWLAEWDASSLLFLRSVTDVSLVDMASKKVVARHAVSLIGRRSVALSNARLGEAEEVRIKEVGGRRRWTRYAVQVKRRKDLVAKNKKMADTVTLKVAVPDSPEQGRLFVGLPLDEPCELPFSMSAPFEPTVERTHLREHNTLNAWLIDRLGDLASAVVVHRFGDRPKGGWLAIALSDETAGSTAWKQQRFGQMVKRQREQVSKSAIIRLADGTEVRLGDLLYEPTEFESLLTVEDLERLWNETSGELGSRRAVPPKMRDAGRWREVLEDLPGHSSPLVASECLTAIAWPDADVAGKGSRWLVEMAAAGLEADEGDTLFDLRCIGLANDAGRLSPSEVEQSGRLLAHVLPSTGIAAALDLAEQLARPFRARTPAAN